MVCAEGTDQPGVKQYTQIHCRGWGVSIAVHTRCENLFKRLFSETEEQLHITPDVLR